MADSLGNGSGEARREENPESSPAKTKKVGGYVLEYVKASKLSEDLINVILGPFLNSLRYGNDLFKLIERDAYFNSYGRYIRGLLQRPDSVIKFAILDDGTIAGWCLFERRTVHYVWVKKEARREGMMRQLLPNEFDVISHLTNQGLKLWANHFPQVIFNPFI